MVIINYSNVYLPDAFRSGKNYFNLALWILLYTTYMCAFHTSELEIEFSLKEFLFSILTIGFYFSLVLFSILILILNF